MYSIFSNKREMPFMAKGRVENNIHANADVYKSLCAQANDMMKMPNGTDAGNGWKKVESCHKGSNFKGVLYEKDGQYALAFVGTDSKNLKDHGANFKMGITGDSRQIQDAKDFARDMQKRYGLTPQNTVSLGHSEAGTESTHVGAMFGFKTFTFNAFGARKDKLPQGVDYDNLVTNYRDAHDPVSKMHANVGKTYITPSTQNWFMGHTPFGSIQAHGIKNMGSCQEAVPLEQFKKNNKWFLDKLSEAEVTREDIGLMDSKLFSLFEPEINNRMELGQIFPSNQLAGMGSVYVEGYTRSDGTQVRGYYRRLARY